jgi:hypothetical protein
MQDKAVAVGPSFAFGFAGAVSRNIRYRKRNGLMNFLNKLFRRSNADDHRKIREVVLEKNDFDLGPSPEGPVFVMDENLTVGRIREIQQELLKEPYLIGVDVSAALPVLLATGKITEAKVRRSASDQVALSRKIRKLVCTDPEVLYMLACARAIDIKRDK